MFNYHNNIIFVCEWTYNKYNTVNTYTIIILYSFTYISSNAGISETQLRVYKIRYFPEVRKDSKYPMYRNNQIFAHRFNKAAVCLSRIYTREKRVSIEESERLNSITEKNKSSDYDNNILRTKHMGELNTLAVIGV